MDSDTRRGGQFIVVDSVEPAAGSYIMPMPIPMPIPIPDAWAQRSSAESEWTMAVVTPEAMIAFLRNSRREGSRESVSVSGFILDNI